MTSLESSLFLSKSHQSVMNGDVKDARMEQRRLATTIRARGMRVLYTLKIEGALAIQCARRSRIEFWNARFYSS